MKRWRGRCVGILFSAFCILDASFRVSAQPSAPLVEVPVPFPNVYYGHAAWGDYDNDGDLDLVITGSPGSHGVTKLFRNDGNGSFVEIGTALAQVRSSSGAWGDYDNDGDLDLALCGIDGDGVQSTRIYRNEGGGNFNALGVNLEPSDGTVLWLDFDNDGDLDLFVNAMFARIFRNDKGSFRDSHASLYSANSASSADYDNNGFWDILIEDFGGYLSLYANTGTNDFRYVNHGMIGGSGATAWGDFNNDGYSDLLLTGGPYPVTASRVYLNRPGSTFFEVNASLPGVSGGIAAWGDYDNDGRLDFFLGGFLIEPRTYIARLYHNDGSNTFSQVTFSATGINSGAAVWGDYDNDSKVDLLLLGHGGTGVGPRTTLYRNTSAVQNSVPAPPYNLQSSRTTNSVNLFWAAPADANQSGGLTYNLRIGTTPGGTDVLSPMSDTTSGYRRVAQVGNTGHRTSWTIRNLAKGTYYWSVQAVDHALAGSAFSAEQRFFIISPVVISDIPDQRISIGSSTGEIPFEIRDSETDPATLTVSGSSSNTNLVPGSGIVFSGAGSNRTVRITPIPGQRGSALITVIARNTYGQIDRDTFTLVADNFPPTISSIPDQFTASGQATAVLPFTVGDVESAAASLVVSARSSNTNFVSNDLIVLAGSGSNRTIRVSPRPGQAGAATILVTVTDSDDGSAVESFQFYSGAPRPTFTSVSSGLPHMDSTANTAWGDYDGDGDLDVLMGGGISSNTYATVLYRNGGNGQFMNTGVPLPPLALEPVAWCDPDSDGDLDIFLPNNGGPTSNLVAIIYYNVNGLFSVYYSFPKGPSGSALAWGDHDNDGDQDLILGGSGLSTTLYRNNRNFSFTALNPGVHDAYLGYMAWGDSDRDGDLDLFLTGNVGSDMVTQLYRNDSGGLVPVLTPLPDARRGEGHWGDYDNDGDLDLLFCGWTGTPDLAVIEVYRNDGNNTFTPVPSTRIPNLYGSAGWGDYDNDGDLDFVAAGTMLSGGGGSTPYTAVYRNEGADVFVNAGLALPQIGAQSATDWVDYDNDGDLDLFLVGNSAPGPNSVPATALLRNNSVLRNSIPTAPQNLTAVVNSNTVTFSWGGGSDENQSAGLTYNLRVGTAPGGNDLVSSMSLGSGQRLLAEQGNASPLLTRTIKNVPYGTYYWSVQSVDHSFAGSAFAPEQTFLINGPPEISIIANRNISYTGSPPIPFTIGDVETPVNDLQVSATSLDTNVIPNENILVEGAGANRTIRLIPITTQGSATIAVTVTDGHQATATRTFTVYLFNSPPTISNIPNQTNSYAGDTGLIPFTIYDPETPGNELVLTVSSSSPSVPATNIVFGGSGTNRTIRITPAVQQAGLSSFITIAVRDALLATTLDSFYVYFVNIRPSVSSIPDQTFTLGTTIPDIPFTVGDRETDANSLSVSASSSNQAMVRNSDLVISGTGSNRTLRINIPVTRSGSANLSINVSDGYGGSFVETFTLTMLQFSEVPSDLPGFSSTALNWVDLDSDGRLDLFGAGATDDGPLTRIFYHLDGGGFLDLGGYFPEMRGSAAWSDYDGDLDLDLILAGDLPGLGHVSLLYENQGGLTFEHQPGVFPGFDGSSSWADYDNDGDADLLLAGAVGTNVYARIYRNDRGSFVESATAFPGVVNPSSAWGDYDNDGDLDLMLLGATISAGIGDVARLYRNDLNGVFTEVTNTTFRGGSHGSVDWGDYDRDGDLDLLLTGLFGGTFTRMDVVYRNNGSDSFTEISLPGAGVAFGSGQWGDFDNDGDLDILVAGHTGSARVLRVIRNDTNSFVDSLAILPGIEGKAAWGDFDRDGDLDIVIAGRSTNLIFKIFENHQPNSNAIPAALISLGSFPGSNFVRLSWSAAADANQSAPRTYNLRVGTAPGASDVMSPMSLPSTGERLLPVMGNVNHALTWTLSGLPRGRYYWSVQAVDHSFAGSAFAAEQSFVVQHRPTISPLADITLPVDTEVPPIDFIIGDFEDPPGTLAVRVASSNTNLLPLANIEVIGSGSNRTLRLIVATNRSGNTAVTVTVTDSDGAFASESFSLRITNTIPTISSIPSQTVARNVTIGPLPFTIGDLETRAENLVLTAFSTNATLVPNQNIVFGGSGSNRTVTVMPAPDQFGRTAISITVTDAHGAFAVKEFVITVLQFHVAGADLLQNTNASLAWGDHDNDGDQDLLLAGMISTNRFARLLRNEGNGSFTDAQLSLPALALSAVAWVDYDNDADLDFMISGQTASNTITHLYRNDGSNGFVLSPARFPGLSQPVFAWGDYDNDGDQDVFLAGRTNEVSGFSFSWLFQNRGSNAFMPSADFFRAYFNGIAAWVDYDNDGDLDLSVAGDGVSGGYGIVQIYKNIRGSFTLEYPPGFEGYPATSLGWSDFDNDNDLDLLLASSTVTFQNPTAIYRNNGTGVLARLQLPNLPQVRSGGGAWADANNDGFSDFIVAGFIYPAPPAGPGAVAQIYRNVQGSNFVALESLLAIGDVKLAWADYDNDSDLDVLLSGTTASNRVTRIYRNDAPATNTPPAPPTNLLALTDVRAAFFSWSAATDLNQAGGFTYNLRVGTTPGGSEILSAMSDPNTGYRRVPQIGNVNQRLSWSLTNLAMGTYYWSVQAIDHSFAGSAFAPEQSFIIQNPPTISDLPNQRVMPNTTISDIAFTVGDIETPLANLILTATSSNTNLVRTEDLVFGGAGNARTLTVIPSSNRVGVATITITVRDENNGIASDSFLLTVTNTRPLISGPANRMFLVNTLIPELRVTVSDSESPADELLLAASSSNTNLVPAENIYFGGSGSNRTLHIVPVPDAIGTTRISLFVADPGGLTNSTAFDLRILATNTPPTISDIPDLVRAANSTPYVVFNIADAENSGVALSVAGTSSNTNLIPAAGLVFAGGGGNRDLTILTTLNQVGLTVITVTVTDELGASASDSFTIQLTNGPPVFGTLPSRTANVAIWSQYFPVPVSDTESPPAFLRPSATSSEQAIVPDGNIQIVFSNSSWRVRFLPQEVGNSTITLTLRDPMGEQTIRSFELTVINSTPSIDNITNRIVRLNSPVPPIPIKIYDLETSPQNLAVTVTSSNTALLPAENIVVSGTSSNRTLTLLPITNVIGASRVTVSVADAHGATNSRSFVLYVVQIELIHPQFAQPTNFQFSLRGVPGINYVVEHSSNLTSWTFFRTISLTTNDTAPVSDPTLPPTRRFYRARPQ